MVIIMKIKILAWLSVLIAMTSIFLWSTGCLYSIFNKFYYSIFDLIAIIWIFIVISVFVFAEQRRKYLWLLLFIPMVFWKQFYGLYMYIYFRLIGFV
jgi:hypothetical protein